MKKNMIELVKIGVVVPALVLSMAACGNSASSDAGKSAEAPAAEAEAEEAAEATEATEATEPAEAPEEPGVETVYENKGFKMTVPAEFANKVIVETPQESDDGVLFEVSEKASVDAAKAKGSDYDGIGWLFAICERDEETFHNMLCYDMSGEDPIGYDANGTYYVFYHPTDVRYERETPEQMQADMDEWTKVVEWGNTMKQDFIDENEGITPFNWSGTTVEAYLAQTAYKEDAVYTISSLMEDAAVGPLEPKNVDAVKYFEKLTKDATYELVEDEEAPDGMYVVLDFPEDEVRFDFFYAEEGKNLIRQVWGDYEQLYRVTFEDDTKTANDIMAEWYNELAANQ